METFDLVEAVNQSDQDLNEFIPGYEELHHLVRRIEFEVRKIEFDIHELEQRKMRLERNGNSVDDLIMKQIGESIETFQGMKDELEKGIPSQWQSERENFKKLNKEARVSRQKYRRNSDSAYETSGPTQCYSASILHNALLEIWRSQLKSIQVE